jgi:hypothetical protein
VPWGSRQPPRLFDAMVPPNRHRVGWHDDGPSGSLNQCRAARLPKRLMNCIFPDAPSGSECAAGNADGGTFGAVAASSIRDAPSVRQGEAGSCQTRLKRHGGWL